jgi:hypothetical protein
MVTPGARRGPENMQNPTTKAHAAPEGDKLRLLSPCRLRVDAMINGTSGDAQEETLVADPFHPQAKSTKLARLKLEGQLPGDLPSFGLVPRGSEALNGYKFHHLYSQCILN